jgi:UDP-N-acetylmuramyl pentapeptide phosphotransferase/UDP-N-acetylglucosamine-1-phosphate transferase
LADELAYIGAFAIAFAMTFGIIPWMIPKLIAKGIVGRDLNKPNAPRIAEMGGIAAVISLLV